MRDDERCELAIEVKDRKFLNMTNNGKKHVCIVERFTVHVNGTLRKKKGGKRGTLQEQQRQRRYKREEKKKANRHVRLRYVDTAVSRGIDCYTTVCFALNTKTSSKNKKKKIIEA
ncbi:hypothetical protein BCY84_00576 [Trypanosoma cruzi cruzi]|nr:hypothetical protein BCY84_00576 [Trypanosoma cruzi cruzi]